MAEFLRSYPLKSRNIIAHVRKATVGAVALENAHPFTRELWGRHWVFAHNGDLKDYQPRLHSQFQPVGSTDSERAFCWLMQELAKSHAGLPSIEEMTLTLRELVPQVRRFGTFNFLLSNGDALWAHCSTKLHYLVRQHPFAQATLMDQDWTVNFADINQPGDRAAVIVTTPLTRNEHWTAFEPNELKVFVDGLPLATPARSA
jgi:glutamine amidotransferase